MGSHEWSDEQKNIDKSRSISSGELGRVAAQNKFGAVSWLYEYPEDLIKIMEYLPFEAFINSKTTVTKG
jgi:hypothetical protein